MTDDSAATPPESHSSTATNMTHTPTAPLDGMTGERWAPRFFTIWTGQALSLVGSGLTQFGLIWWLTISTGSATVLAMASLAGLLPQVVLSPFAGVLADRWNRRLILLLADGIIALATLLLLLLYWLGLMQVWHVYVVMFVRSAGSAFHQPTMAASTSLLVPKTQLARVGGLNQMLQGITGVASPMLGALLLSFAGLGVVMAVDIVTAAFAILPLFFFRIPQPPADPLPGNESVVKWVLNDLREGLRYVRVRRGLIYALAISTLLNFLITPAFSLMPLYVNSVFGGDAQMLALVEMLLGIGMIVGGLLLAAWGGFRNKAITALAGIATIGLGVAVIGVAPADRPWVLVAGGFIVGFAVSFANGPILALLQSVVASEMQARVFSLTTTAALAITPFSLAIAGPLADALGIRIWYLLAALVCISLAILGYFVADVREMEQHLALVAANQRAGEETRA